MSSYHNDAIFWVEVNKVRPNPFQPRTEFDESKLKTLADSIRQYGVLQPLVLTRHEEEKEDGGIATYYELIAGERRLRASKIAGLSQIPVIIRSSEEHDHMKLELAIIENLQREDLNAIDRARAFQRLQKEFDLNNTQIGKKVGKSREYVSNSLRLLNLPEEMQNAVMAGKLSEGHARALLMLDGRAQEQETVFRDILLRKLSVREVEKITRGIATDKVRKKDPRPEITALERAFAERFGTPVEIKEKDNGGKLIINFYSTDDLEGILSQVENKMQQGMSAAAPVSSVPHTDNAPLPDAEMATPSTEQNTPAPSFNEAPYTPAQNASPAPQQSEPVAYEPTTPETSPQETHAVGAMDDVDEVVPPLTTHDDSVDLLDDRSDDEKKDDDDDFSVANFSI